MFVCRGCLRSLTGAGAGAAARWRPRLAHHSLQQTAAGSVASRRSYMAKLDLQRPAEDLDHEDLKDFRIRPAGARTATRAQPPDSQNDGDAEYEQISEKAGQLGREKYEKKLQYAANKVLSLAQDPYHIAQHVTDFLDKGNFDMALMLARMASRDRKVEVSWNHLIDYQMRNGRLHAAVKLFNEMKKRAQEPNVKTYTIIFRGCAMSTHPKLAVSEATRIYTSMFARSPIRPNTIHMNAVLNVCARANDLDSLFTTLQTCDTGLRMPDAYTYTIVLNALRVEAENITKGNLGLIDAEVKREVQRCIQKARSAWLDALASWKSGQMILDEQVVFSMARVLTMGDYKDNEDVLQLVEDTMQIPRFDLPNPKLPIQPKEPKQSTDSAQTGESASEEADSDTQKSSPPVPQEPTINLKMISPREKRELARSRNTAFQFAQPGNLALSVILTALGNLRKTGSAVKYYNYFSDVLKVRPDEQTQILYLRTCTLGHASAQVADIITNMPTAILLPTTFRRGFQACIHDNLNKNAFANACRIFDHMTLHLRYADATAMRLFLQVARSNTRHFYDRADQNPDKRETLPERPDPSVVHPPENPDLVPPAAPAHLAQLITALERMWEPFRILTGSVSYPSTRKYDAEARIFHGVPQTHSREEELNVKRTDMQEIMATARRMISAIDRVTNDVDLAAKLASTQKAAEASAAALAANAATPAQMMAAAAATAQAQTETPNTNPIFPPNQQHQQQQQNPPPKSAAEQRRIAKEQHEQHLANRRLVKTWRLRRIILQRLLERWLLLLHPDREQPETKDERLERVARKRAERAALAEAETEDGAQQEEVGDGRLGEILPNQLDQIDRIMHIRSLKLQNEEEQKRIQRDEEEEDASGRGRDRGSSNNPYTVLEERPLPYQRRWNKKAASTRGRMPAHIKKATEYGRSRR